MQTALLLAEVSKESYNDRNEIDLSHLGFTLVDFVEGHEDIQAVIMERDDLIVVGFRGTDSIEDVARDLSAFLSRFKPDRFRLFKRPRVHLGFLDGYMEVRDTIRNRVLELNAIKERKIYMTGHSMGGALATLMAYDLNKIAKVPAGVYSYGSPRVGNNYFTKIFGKFVKDSFRIVNDEDPVCSVPFGMFGHVDTYVLLDDEENLIINPGILEKIEKEFEGIEDIVSGQAIKEHSMTNYIHLLSTVKNVKIRD